MLSDASAADGVRPLRLEVRAFLRDAEARGVFRPACDAWLAGFAPEFSRLLGARGWLGLTWPTRYGGHALTPLHRFAVVEELLVAGAPVAAHWMAERQSGPSILQYGTEEQRTRLLPPIAAGESYFAIGMSEPDSGSDLASIRTAAVRTGEGWRLNGRKLWTSHAHRAHFMIALVRTGDAGPDRHGGLSQFVIDLRLPGITVRPVRLIDGSHHFNEVVLDDVQLPPDALLGVEGNGWEQVMRELALERGGPERYLTTFPLVIEAVRRVERDSRAEEVIGRLVAQLWALRQLCLSASAPDPARPTAQLAAITKDAGTRLEQQTVDIARSLVPGEIDPGSDDDFVRLLAEATLHSPGFTVRGGTGEILRGLIAAAGGRR